MASVKVKFRPSTVLGHEGIVYYQIIHERKVRQLRTEYKVLAIVLPNFRPAERGFKSKISRQCEPDSSLG